MTYLKKFRLDGRRALVTGAAKGIGYAISEALAEAGAQVILSDFHVDNLSDAKGRLEMKYADVKSVELDVTDSRSVTMSAEKLEAELGPIDILVNNAGIALSNEPAEAMQDDIWNRVIDVNLNGVFWCCRAFGSRMLQRRSGTIVNVGSMSAQIVNRPQEQSNYNASKAAVHHLTRSLAAEWADRGVRVNAVAPTYIATEMTAYAESDPELKKYWLGGTPMGRMGHPEEVASVVLFLASDASSLMTGSIVLADGGYSCW